jgi:RNA polymerase sigma-70 factor (ECF subfamily)
MPDQDMKRSDERRRIRLALDRLGKRQREILELVFYQDMTIEDSAEVMGVSLGTARTHYERAKRRIIRELDEP